MINLDQVRTLEWKVKQAVQLIVHLRRENDVLRGRLSDTEVRLQELENLLETVRATQTEMESGIRNALEELDHLEGTEDETAALPAAVDAGPLSYPPSPQEMEPPSKAPVAETESLEAEAEASFEEEFAALAAAEAAALVEPEAVSAADAVPASVELEDEEEARSPAEEAHEPEQPGLGIF